MRSSDLVLNVPLTHTANCVLITRQDGTRHAFTDHDSPVRLGNTVYRPHNGFERTAIEDLASLEAGTVELIGGFGDEISRNDVRRGLYDFARIAIYVADYTAGDDQKPLQLFAGRIHLGRLRSPTEFRFDVRNLKSFLRTEIGDIVQKRCRAILGDTPSGCKVDLDKYSISGATVQNLSDADQLVLAGLKNPNNVDYQDAGWFQGGTVRAAGVLHEIADTNIKVVDENDRSKDQLEITLAISALFDDWPAGEAIAYPGCAKTVEICSGRFDNLSNYRGEPDLPGEVDG